MDFGDYQREAMQTAIYPHVGHAVVYPLLGLGNEVGEVQGKIKKIFRDKGGTIADKDKIALQDELGDVLWYLSQVATELGLELDDIAQGNLSKLFDRQERNVIQGDGDNR